MKRLATNKDCDIQILTGPVTAVQKRLDSIFELYDVVIHGCNVNDRGDVVVIIERRHRDKA